MKQWEVLDKFAKNVKIVKQIIENSYSPLLMETEAKWVDIDFILNCSNPPPPLYAASIHLLIQEMSCVIDAKSKIWTQINEKFSKIPQSTLVYDWIEEVIAGLRKDAFPTLSALLMERNLPSCYPELTEIFPCTLILNKLAAIYNANEAINMVDFLEEFECFHINAFVSPLKELIDRNFSIPSLSLHKISNTKLFEVENYLSLEYQIEFPSIPIELIEITEGKDSEVPFGKRWLRRTMGKVFGFEKIFYSSTSTGPFPKSFKTIDLSLNVKLPESLDPNLLDLNFFDPKSMLDQQFMEILKFSVLTSQLLTEIPARLKNHVRNTEIFKQINRDENGNLDLVSLRAVLLSLGLRGHLNIKSTLPPVDIHEILNYSDSLTSSILLFSLSCSHLGSSDKFLSKLAALHITSFQSIGSGSTRSIPELLQKSSIISFGLLQLGSFNRGPAQLLFKEIFSADGQIARNYWIHQIISAFSLGFLMSNVERGGVEYDKIFAQDLGFQIIHKMHESNFNRIPAAIVLSTIFANSDIGRNSFISLLYWSRSIKDILSRGEMEVFWLILSYRLMDWNDLDGLDCQGFNEPKLNIAKIIEQIGSGESIETWCSSPEVLLFAYSCSVIAANAMFFGIKYSGSKAPSFIIQNIDDWIVRIQNITLLLSASQDYFTLILQHHLLFAYQHLLLCRCLIFSGSADTETWRSLRLFYSHPLLFQPGNSVLFHASLGFLFLSQGRGRISVYDQNKQLDGKKLSLLLASLYPFFQVSSAEEPVVEMIRRLWTFTLQPKYQ